MTALPVIQPAKPRPCEWISVRFIVDRNMTLGPIRHDQEFAEYMVLISKVLQWTVQ